MASTNDATHFCSRPDGKLTTMVCVDDLSTDVIIEGAPRTIGPADTQGMTSCGVIASRAEPWKVTSAALTTKPDTDDLIDKFRHLLTDLVNDVNVSVHYRTTIQELLASREKRPVQNRNFNGRNQGGPRGKKEFCSYWIRHGECDYQQQGCLFKHEMPLDAAGLEVLGLRDIPRWYREKYNVPSLLRNVNGGRAQQALPAPPTNNNGTPKFRALTYYPTDDASMAGSYSEMTPASNSNNVQGSRNGNGRKTWRSGPGKRYNDANTGFGFDNIPTGQVTKQYAIAPAKSAPVQDELISPPTSSESFVIDLGSGLNSPGFNNAGSQSAGLMGTTFDSAPISAGLNSARSEPLALTWHNSIGSVAGGVPLPAERSVSGSDIMATPRIHPLGRLTDMNTMPHGASSFQNPLNTRLPRLDGQAVQSAADTELYNAHSRRLFGMKGMFDGSQSFSGPTLKDIIANESIYLTPSAGTHPVLGNMGMLLRRIVDKYEPITTWDVLFNHDPVIGTDIIYPSMMDTQAEIDARAKDDVFRVSYAPTLESIEEVNEMAGIDYEAFSPHIRLARW